MLSRNQSSCSASRTGESGSRSSDDFCGSSSPKILLTASRDGFEESVTSAFRCDEDHILVSLAVNIDLKIWKHCHSEPAPSGYIPFFQRKLEVIRSPSWIAGR